MDNDEMLARKIGERSKRKLRARGNAGREMWFGFGTVGVIGWSVVIPTLIGALAGRWIDQRFPGGHSWTLALLVAGLTLGCFNGWHWVSQENRAIHPAPGGEDE